MLWNNKMSTDAIKGLHDAADQIVPNESSPKRDLKTQVSHIVGAFTTKRGLLGCYDYGIYRTLIRTQQ